MRLDGSWVKLFHLKVHRKLMWSHRKLFVVLNDIGKEKLFAASAFLMSAVRLNVSSGGLRSAIFNKATGVLFRDIRHAHPTFPATPSFARWIVRNVPRAQTFLFVSNVPFAIFILCVSHCEIRPMSREIREFFFVFFKGTAYPFSLCVSRRIRTKVDARTTTASLFLFSRKM